MLLKSLFPKRTRSAQVHLKIISMVFLLICTQLHAGIDQSDATKSYSNNSHSSNKVVNKVVLVLGDSLSAAYGLTQEQGWVSLLQDVLVKHDNPDLAAIKLINASISGETTDGGLARLQRLLSQHQPTDVLIELGGNKERIAQARMNIEQARLLTLQAAWKIDNLGVKNAMVDISAIKVVVPNMLESVVDMAVQIHGGGGMSNDFPLARFAAGARMLRLADGPDEVHMAMVSRLELRKYK